MKRYVVGTLLFSIVMFVQLFGNIPVFADTFVPTSSYDFTGLADLGYALVGGAEFDFEGSPYVIDDYNSLSAEQKEIQKSLAARQFLLDYMESRGIAYEEDGELHKGSTYYTIAFGLAGQEFFEAFQTASAAEQEDLTYNMPISPSRFADWAQYNKYWFNRYATDFQDDSIITPNPDVNYASICSNISSYIYYFPNTRYNVNFGTCTYEYNIGFGNYPLIPQYPFSICWGISGNMSYFTDIGTVYLTLNQDGTVSANYVFQNKTAFLNNNGLGKNWTSNVSFQDYSGEFATKLILRDALSISNDNINEVAQNNFESLSDAMNYLNQHFRNINLYVNDNCWAYIDSAPANPVIPDFPDIINQETGELAYDITMPKTQDYSGSFDLTALFDAIREGIAGASDGDLATGSTIGSLDVGRTYTGEGIDIQDRVIDLTSSRVFDGTLTDDTTGRLPKPPVVPPAVSAGLGGVTVLAKYIDATQCILPDELMTAFWGCVWILIILGLIKNLHR